MNNTKNEMKNYYTEIHANGFKHTNGFHGFASACAHFSTDAELYTPEYINAMKDAIELIGGQQVSHGWMGYTIGKTFEETGREPVSVMSPAWEYRTEATMTTPIWKEVEKIA